MGKVGAWVDKKKLRILEKALQKGENISEKHSWTIYFLVDLKVVYIITYAYITIVNLISSTANSEAISDAQSMMPFNVTLLLGQRDVDSISDSILWNCRRQSVTNYYYRFLYLVLIIAMGAALVGYFVVKLMALITLNFFCRCPCILNEYGLAKLWQIAVLEELKVKWGELLSQSQQQQQQQPATGSETTSPQPEENNYEQPQSDSNPQRNSETQVVKVEIENKKNTNVRSGMSQSHQSSLMVQKQAEGNAHDEIQAPHDGMQTSPPGVDTIKIETAKSTQSSKLELKAYQLLLNDDVTSDIFKDLGCRSKWSNYCRQIIPAFLLFLSVITLGLSFLSYDLHPLACMVRPAEDFISYNATTKRVKLEFSGHLRDFQKSAGIIVIFLSIVFLLLAWSFHYLSNKVIEYLKAEVEKRINKTKQLGPKRVLHHKEDTIADQHLPTPP